MGNRRRECFAHSNGDDDRSALTERVGDDARDEHAECEALERNGGIAAAVSPVIAREALFSASQIAASDVARNFSCRLMDVDGEAAINEFREGHVDDGRRRSVENDRERKLRLRIELGARARMNMRGLRDIGRGVRERQDDASFLAERRQRDGSEFGRSVLCSDRIHACSTVGCERGPSEREGGARCHGSNEISIEQNISPRGIVC